MHSGKHTERVTLHGKRVHFGQWVFAPLDQKGCCIFFEMGTTSGIVIAMHWKNENKKTTPVHVFLQVQKGLYRDTENLRVLLFPEEAEPMSLSLGTGLWH
jgi:hypothetical protein